MDTAIPVYSQHLTHPVIWTERINLLSSLFAEDRFAVRQFVVRYIHRSNLNCYNFSWAGPWPDKWFGSCKNKKPEQTDPMSKAYWEFWNPEVQASIDKDIEQYRKAEAILKFDRLSAGTEAKVEQISHDFIYDANIFIFYILGSNELNDKYKDLFGTLFNSATIPFYWKKFEIKPDSLRFNEEYWDTEEYWNQVEDPNSEPHWRRPAPEPILEFCESKGIRKHGHPITWGENKWHYPEWIYEEFWPEDEKEKINGAGENGLDSLTPARIENLVPVYCSEINRLFRKRIIELIDYYGGRLES